MAQEEYLNRLLNTYEDRVQGECAICFETYNTMNTSTGIIEAGVRLSCGHTVGSACIATWLRDQNNCPLCRETFFPRQPRPYLEHGIMDVGSTSTVRIPTGPGMPPALANRGLDSGRSSTVRVPAGHSDVGRSRAATVSMRPEPPTVLTPCRLRYLDAGIFSGEPIRHLGVVAGSIARLMYQYQVGESSLPNLRNQDSSVITAVAFYMASHLLRQPRSPETYLLVASPDQIRSAYTYAYPVRRQFIHADILDLIAGNRLGSMLAFLPRPEGTDGMIDDEEERQEFRRRNHSPQAITDETHELCRGSSSYFGDPNIEYISKKICKMELLERRLGLRSPPMKAAISIYMAIYLLGGQVSVQRIAYLLHISASNLNIGYARIYPGRYHLLKPKMLSAIARKNMPRALGAMPPFNWPPLDM